MRLRAPASARSGTVFIDQAYWQSAVAAQPTATVKGFLVGGLVWFAVPFCMATTFGLAGRALSSSGRVPITFEQADAGLVPAIVITDLLGEGGAFALLTMLFMAVTSTGSAEVIAVSSILTYDLFWTYLLPELREAVRATSMRWRTAVAAAHLQNEMALSQEDVGRLLAELRATSWLRDGTAFKSITLIAHHLHERQN
jgi:Na+/proline symporter